MTTDAADRTTIDSADLTGTAFTSRQWTDPGTGEKRWARNVEPMLRKRRHQLDVQLAKKHYDALARLGYEVRLSRVRDDAPDPELIIDAA